ncbi:hypothetical protein LXT21_44390 [Myxococcus sp. K38C18041901]|uniref:hypothetical protein n=1 Tax=Myxococcus guangdongensis TaxID=2906760 RepID=UPI0020A82AAA|nr:hypothetical protein [Myxococcus guangdongensis]MCP3065830.1 hypothetical protein [Myxococcus guangdongensis]
MPFEWQPELEKVDEVPERLRALYTKVDAAEGAPEKYVLDEELAKRLDTSALTGSLRKERDSNKTLKGQLAGFEKLGLKTPEEVEQRLAELGTQLREAQKGVKGAEAWAKERTSLEEKHSKALGDKDAEVKRLTSVLHKQLAEGAVRDALTKNEGAIELMLPIMAPHVVLVEEAGKFLVRVVDDEGNPRENKSGSPMTVDEYVVELKKDSRFTRAFKGTGSSGGGMPPGAPPGGIPGGGKMTALERIQRGLGRK